MFWRKTPNGMAATTLILVLIAAPRLFFDTCRRWPLWIQYPGENAEKKPKTRGRTHGFQLMMRFLWRNEKYSGKDFIAVCVCPLHCLYSALLCLCLRQITSTLSAGNPDWTSAAVESWAMWHWRSSSITFMTLGHANQPAIPNHSGWWAGK